MVQEMYSLRRWLIELKLSCRSRYDYDMNLVQRFNESMEQYGVPTCPSYTYIHGKQILIEGGKTTVYDFDNTTVVAKVRTADRRVD